MRQKNNTMKGVWISLEILQIEDLKLQYKLFLAEIDNLDNGVGCWADNAHFARVFLLSKNRCSEIIDKLWNNGFIDRQVVDNAEFGVQRTLRLLAPFEKVKPLVSRIVETSTGAVETSTGAVDTSTRIIGTEYITEYIEEVSVGGNNLNFNLLVDKILRSSMCIEAAARQCKLNIKEIQALVPHFAVHIIGLDKSYNNNTEFLSHFQSWCRKQPKGVADVTVEVEWFISMFNKVSGKSFKATKKVSELFKTQLSEGFTGDDMLAAVKNLYSSKNTWHKKQNYIEATPEFLLTGDRLNKFVNAKF
jgi:hypothetical protein